MKDRMIHQVQLTILFTKDQPITHVDTEVKLNDHLWWQRGETKRSPM